MGALTASGAGVARAGVAWTTGRAALPASTGALCIERGLTDGEHYTAIMGVREAFFLVLPCTFTSRGFRTKVLLPDTPIYQAKQMLLKV